MFCRFQVEELKANSEGIETANKKIGEGNKPGVDTTRQPGEEGRSVSGNVGGRGEKKKRQGKRKEGR